MKKEEFIQKIAGYVKKYAAAYEIKVCSPIIAQAILDEILPYMNIYPDEETEETTKLWDGFKGVLRLDDSEVEVNEPIVQTEGSETGTDNAQDIEVVQDESGSSEEYNDEEIDGVASENAGYEETVSEDVSD